MIRGADHGYLGADFELAVSYILDFLNAEQAAVQETESGGVLKRKHL